MATVSSVAIYIKLGMPAGVIPIQDIGRDDRLIDALNFAAPTISISGYKFR
jgi:hypothetical protein